MFKEANGSSDFMRDMFMKLSESQLEVVYAQQNATIYFTKTHNANLTQVIEVDETSDAPEPDLMQPMPVERSA